MKMKRHKMSRWRSPERTEHVGIDMTMDGSVYKKVKNLVDGLGIKDIGTVWDIDTVKVQYDFTIEYYGVVRQLDALIELMNYPEVTYVWFGEAAERDILIADFIDALRALQARLTEDREQA